jgi:hypothetical protein
LREFNDKRQDSTGARKEEEEKSLAAGGVRVEFQRRGDLQNKCLLIEKQHTRNRFCGT